MKIEIKRMMKNGDQQKLKIEKIDWDKEIFNDDVIFESTQQFTSNQSRHKLLAYKHSDLQKECLTLYSQIETMKKEMKKVESRYDSYQNQQV